MLKKYLDGKISEEELKSFALFILAMDTYVQPNEKYCEENPTDYEAADLYEDMWYILQQLSSPEIDGELTSERAEKFIETLKQLLRYNREG